MENISREAILRMVGLHDKAHLMRQINAIQLSLEEQDGQMVAYYTEIQKDERQISLIAGRVSANETSIGQLQVTAQSLTASVSSLNTTVSGHTTKIASLELTDQSLTASVSSLTTQVNSIDGTVSTHTTKIASLELTDQSLTASVSSLNTTVGTHTTKIASLELTDTSISNRVTAIEGDYVKEAEISLMVKKDGNGYISNANIKADRIDFTFTQSTNFISGGQTVMNIDSSGNLWIAGEYKGGSITGQITVGTGTNKMYIQPNASNGADLVGYSGATEVLKLGFVVGDSGYTNITPSLSLSYYNNGSLQFISQLKPYYLSIKNNTNSDEALIMADRMSIDGDIRATSFAIKSGSTIYTGVNRTVTIGSTTLTIKGGIITDVS